MPDPAFVYPHGHPNVYARLITTLPLVAPEKGQGIRVVWWQGKINLPYIWKLTEIHDQKFFTVYGLFFRTATGYTCQLCQNWLFLLYFREVLSK
jgi:hypothetical protein